jgi:hypothetical protein
VIVVLAAAVMSPQLVFAGDNPDAPKQTDAGTPPGEPERIVIQGERWARDWVIESSLSYSSGSAVGAGGGAKVTSPKDKPASDDNTSATDCSSQQNNNGTTPHPVIISTGEKFQQELDSERARSTACLWSGRIAVSTPRPRCSGRSGCPSTTSRGW